MTRLMRVGAGIVLLLAGCTSRFDVRGTEWAKPGAMFQQVTVDEMECARRAEAMNAPDTVIGGLADVVVLNVFEARRASAFRGCMAAKGYQRVRS